MINLAFEELATDRITSLIAFHELRGLAKGRKFKYIAIDVAPSTLAEKKGMIEKLIYPQATVMDLSIGTALFFGLEGKGKTFSDAAGLEGLLQIIVQEFPKIYTDNKGGKCGEIAISAGKNKLFSEAFAQIKGHLNIDTCSSALIVLNGLGADEIFGGYSRYYAYAKSNQIEELKSEFSLGKNKSAQK